MRCGSSLDWPGEVRRLTKSWRFGGLLEELEHALPLLRAEVELIQGAVDLDVQFVVGRQAGLKDSARAR